MVEYEVIETIKDALELNVVEKKEKSEAENFAKIFGEQYLANSKYETKDVVDAINIILTKIAKKSKRLVGYIIVALQLLFPQIDKKYPFIITA